MIGDIFSISSAVRYVAVYRGGELRTESRATATAASSSETDRYEELLVNPTLLKLATQRGEIDCGGLGYLIIRYGHFFQVVLPASWGHVSICVEKDADPVQVAVQVQAMLSP